MESASRREERITENNVQLNFKDLRSKIEMRLKKKREKSLIADSNLLHVCKRPAKRFHALCSTKKKKTYFHLLTHFSASVNKQRLHAHNLVQIIKVLPTFFRQVSASVNEVTTLQPSPNHLYLGYRVPGPE